jgi:hypothetical protein
MAGHSPVNSMLNKEVNAASMDYLSVGLNSAPATRTDTLHSRGKTQA